MFPFHRVDVTKAKWSYIDWKDVVTKYLYHIEEAIHNFCFIRILKNVIIMCNG